MAIALAATLAALSTERALHWLQTSPTMTAPVQASDLPVPTFAD